MFQLVRKTSKHVAEIGKRAFNRDHADLSQIGILIQSGDGFFTCWTLQIAADHDQLRVMFLRLLDEIIAVPRRDDTDAIAGSLQLPDALQNFVRNTDNNGLHRSGPIEN